MNINKKIIELGVALWEQRATEVAQRAADCNKDTEKLLESFNSEMQLETGEMKETIDFIRNTLEPKQKAILLFWLTMIMTMLAASEDGISSAPVVAGTIIKATHEFLKKDPANKGAFTLPEMVSMSIAIPRVMEEK